ncbi:MAG: hypothetical protein QG620_464 [Patescibacteria group bacterium]|nr:hypothetical protein [Patescibacteria group bacterium]
MDTILEKLAYDWITASADDVDVESEYYCQTRDVFEGRNDRMPEDLILKGMDESLAYLVYAIAGELGNNSFDHNVGNWPDVMGTFYAFDYDGKNGILVIADRGIGVLDSLRKALPDLKDAKEALEIAFTKKISSRVLENRGNGLKFIRGNVSEKNLTLEFLSGNARADINHEMKIGEASQSISGCLAVLKF